jgi:hypothetical protein
MRKSVMRANPTTKRSIPIDEIRALQHRLTTRPTLGAAPRDYRSGGRSGNRRGQCSAEKS